MLLLLSSIPALAADAEEAEEAEEPEVWSAGLNPGGGGLYVKSPDGGVLFRLYGYAQPTLTLTDDDNNAPYEEADFRVRRARIDFSVDYAERYKLFLEFDGAPADGTALIEAWAQAAYVKGRHHLRVGKFITPFSTENLRSSRALETVERYIALNAMFGLPALDVQFGPMLWGHLGEAKRLTYYLGVWNGNASAGAGVVSGQRGNARDNNGEKELQARLDVRWTDAWRTGVAFDLSDEEAQTLALPSYSGVRYVAIPVEGGRRGIDLDAHWRRGRWSFDAEGLAFEFEDAGAELAGGYLQGGWWVRGGELEGGVQGVLRLETAELGGEALAGIDGRRIDAVTLGANVWWNGWTRWQVNLIGERFDGRGNAAFTEGEGWRPTLLSQFQIKF